MTLGERRVWRGQGRKRKCVSKKDTFMYIPLLSTLQSLLQNRDILAEVSCKIEPALSQLFNP